MVAHSRRAFNDARLRVRWAKESLANFERIARRYFKRTPYERITEADPDGRRERHKLRLLKPMPVSLTNNAIRTVENLRSALDLTAAAVAELAGVSTDNVYFPFSKAASDFDNRIGSCCKGFPKDITELWRGYEPYGRADNLLFAINEICNTSKHRVIVHVAPKAGVHMPLMETSDVLTLPIEIVEGMWDDENEITYAITQRGLKWRHRVQIAMGIAFGNVGEAAGFEVEPNLAKMCWIVETIIDGTEAKCREIGLI